MKKRGENEKGKESGKKKKRKHERDLSFCEGLCTKLNMADAILVLRHTSLHEWSAATK